MTDSSDAEARPPIPSDLRRRVLIEAGHRCAIPTCRHIEVDVHHIIPWAQCKAHEYDNLIALCPNDHRRADRGEIDRKSLRLYKTNLRFAHDKFSQVEIDLLFMLSRQATPIKWPQPNLILLFRILDAGFVQIIQAPGAVMLMGLNIAPVELTLTQKGRAFISDLSDHEL